MRETHTNNDNYGGRGKSAHKSHKPSTSTSREYTDKGHNQTNHQVQSQQAPHNNEQILLRLKSTTPTS